NNDNTNNTNDNTNVDNQNNNNDDPVVDGTGIVFREVRFNETDRIELLNTGSLSVDLSGFTLCANRDYLNVDEATVVAGSLMLGAGESVILEGLALENASDLAIYNTQDRSAFADAGAIVSYVKWGDSDTPNREATAVAAGLWTANTFVDVSALPAGDSIENSNDGVDVADWQAQDFPSLADDPNAPDVVITELRYTRSDRVELKNMSTRTIDLATYWLCSALKYAQLSELSAILGDYELAPGEEVIVAALSNVDPADPSTGVDLTLNAQGSLGLYTDNQFANADSMVHYVQWGAGAQDRESVAVSAGLWTANDFVAAVADGSSIVYDGAGFASGDWAEDATPSLADVRILRFRHTDNERVQLRNDHDAPIDVSDYAFCTGPGEYPVVNTLELVEGGLTVPAGGNVTLGALAAGLGDTEGELSLYLPGSQGAFGDRRNIVDFVQWGADQNRREGIAVDAGLWSTDAFVSPVATGADSLWDRDNAGDAGWVVQAFDYGNDLAPVTNVVISEVRYDDDFRIELENISGATVDVTNWQLCVNRAYVGIGDLQVIDGSLSLDAGESVVVRAFGDSTSGANAVFTLGGNSDVALYANADGFGDAANLRHYVKWADTAVDRLDRE
ncbi:MAG: lamin tail domain-containing protein, partial [Myxococcota bacterium]